MDGHLRHLPRGVDQYLELRAKQQSGAPATKQTGPAAAPKLGGAELRTAQKEQGAASRKLEKTVGQIAELHERMATHDQFDYAGLGALSTELTALQGTVDSLEFRLLELDELLGS
jgi:uncharacterized protein involved in outer membrane biogenesis